MVDLFGDAVKPAFVGRRFAGVDGRQASLFSTVGVAGQLDLFDDGPAPSPQFDAAHAWELGYGDAVRGIVHPPAATWVDEFLGDWRAGHAAAIADGKWATWRG